MDIEEAKEKIKFSTYSCLPFGSVMTDKEALEIVLSELEKKDKMIDEMAKEIFDCNEYIDNEFARELNFKTEEQVIEYFTNKVEKEGK